jgi:hypothetical protein
VQREKDPIHLCLCLLSLERAHGDDFAREALVGGVLDFVYAREATLAEETNAVELVFT